MQASQRSQSRDLSVYGLPCPELLLLLRLAEIRADLHAALDALSPRTASRECSVLPMVTLHCIASSTDALVEEKAPWLKPEETEMSEEDLQEMRAHVQDGLSDASDQSSTRSYREIHERSCTPISGWCIAQKLCILTG